MNVTDIEKRIDLAIAASTPINAELGGVTLESMAQVLEFAKAMSTAGAAVPKWLRNNVGGCLAICARALRWKMCPFAVAEKSYLVNNRGEEHVAFEAQLIHAVVEARAPLKGRLRHEIIGEGDQRRCKVEGTFRGEDKAHVYISEPLAKLREARGRNANGEVRGSPLWVTQPEVQLAYSAYRQWCRLYSPDTLLGVYARDELQGSEVDVTPKPLDGLAQRLRDAKKARVGKHGGFDPERVARVGAAILEGAAEPDDAKQEVKNDKPR